MKVYDWGNMTLEQMNPHIARQVIHAETMTVARIYLSKGGVVPEHSHFNEQISMLQQGKLRFTMAGEERVLTAGEVIQIPPNVPHRVDALEDSVALDLFSPVREDWIRGDDAYLRK
jgi:quercetin dioxygenase-like cupin family protein